MNLHIRERARLLVANPARWLLFRLPRPIAQKRKGNGPSAFAAWLGRVYVWGTRPPMPKNRNAR